MGTIKTLFDSKRLLSDETEEKIIVLDRIEEIEPIPTLTVQLNDAIREKQQDLFHRYNQIVFHTTGSGTRRSQEGQVKSQKLVYAQKLVDLCVVGSTGLFEQHDNTLLKKVFVRQSSFLDYVLSELTKVFDGDVSIADAKDDDEKN